MNVVCFSFFFSVFWCGSFFLIAFFWAEVGRLFFLLLALGLVGAGGRVKSLESSKICDRSSLDSCFWGCLSIVGVGFLACFS